MKPKASEEKVHSIEILEQSDFLINDTVFFLFVLSLMSFFRTFENVKKLILIFDIHVKENATSKTN